MAEENTQGIKVTENGSKGIALLGPALTLPMIVHGIAGVLVGGVGIAAASVLLAPLAGNLFKGAGKAKEKAASGEPAPPASARQD